MPLNRGFKPPPSRVSGPGQTELAGRRPATRVRDKRVRRVEDEKNDRYEGCSHRGGEEGSRIRFPYRIVLIVWLFFLFFTTQENVPDGQGVVHGVAGRPAVRGAHGHRAGGQQAVPLRVPPLVVAGRGQGGSARAAPAVHAPRLAVHR